MAFYVRQPIACANKIVELVCFDCFCTVAYARDGRSLAVAETAHEQRVHSRREQVKTKTDLALAAGSKAA
jgi:hypothetical protein